MRRVTVDHPHNEASALTAIRNRRILDGLGCDIAFWALSDEKKGPEALAALGREPDGGWKVVPLRSKKSGGGRTEDCETMARAGSWLYVFGSQFGSKDGPLEPKRHFVMRLNEAMLKVGKKEIGAEIEVARRPFLFHRLINDALQEGRLSLHPELESLREPFVNATRDRGQEKKKSWRDLVRRDDLPINIEGSTFLPGGNLLIGLRYPVTDAGNPILIEIEGIDRYFEKKEDPEVIGVRVLENVGKPQRPAGVRELDYSGGLVHVISGDIECDSVEKAPSEHWTVNLVEGQRGATAGPAKRIRKFDPGSTVEGIAIQDGEIWYAHDAEQIVLDVAETA
jgi:hypothetical protein